MDKTNDSAGLASYVAGQVDQSLCWEHAVSCLPLARRKQHQPHDTIDKPWKPPPPHDRPVARRNPRTTRKKCLANPFVAHLPPRDARSPFSLDLLPPDLHGWPSMAALADGDGRWLPSPSPCQASSTFSSPHPPRHLLPLMGAVRVSPKPPCSGRSSPAPSLYSPDPGAENRAEASTNCDRLVHLTARPAAGRKATAEDCPTRFLQPTPPAAPPCLSQPPPAAAHHQERDGSFRQKNAEDCACWSAAPTRMRPARRQHDPYSVFLPRDLINRYFLVPPAHHRGAPEAAAAAVLLPVPLDGGMASDAKIAHRTGKKLPMEDVSCYKYPLTGAKQFGMFGIFYGHGGDGAAKAASRILPENVANILSQ